jgi:probable rRNA maturation factor
MTTIATTVIIAPYLQKVVKDLVFLQIDSLDPFFSLIAQLANLMSAHVIKINVCITTDKRMRLYNRTYRNKDKSTNVLAFPAYHKGDPLAHDPLGDIILNFSYIQKEAMQLAIPIKNHLMHLLAHGFLHLLHFDHQEESEAEQMENLERQALAHIGLDLPLDVTKQ